MSWRERLRQTLASLKSSLAGGKRAHTLTLATYATSQHSVGAHVFRHENDVTDGLAPIANLAGYRADGQEAHASVIFLDAALSADGTTDQILDLVSRFLRQEHDLNLGSCDMALQRSKPLAESSPLSGGYLHVASCPYPEGAGRHLLRWISEENHNAGRLDDANHVIVAAADVVCGVAPEEAAAHRHVNIAVFHRCGALVDPPTENVWHAFVEAVGDGDVTSVRAYEAIRLPSIDRIWTN